MNIQKILFFFTLPATILLTSSCDRDGGLWTCTKGEGAITTSTLSVDDFTGLTLDFSGNVTVKQGTPQKVEVTGHPNIIEELKTEVSNDLWLVELKNGCYKNFDLSIEITMPNLEEVQVNGSGDIVVNDFANQSGTLSLEVNGSGSVTINEFEGITELNAAISGSGDINTNNDITSLEMLNINKSGSGDYLGFAVSANDCIVDSSGSGDCELTAPTTLEVTISGSGDVFFKGNPTIIQNISGSGELIDAN